VWRVAEVDAEDAHHRRRMVGEEELLVLILHFAFLCSPARSVSFLCSPAGSVPSLLFLTYPMDSPIFCS
jgi:hypothetical protein